jgi:Zn-dependent protease
VLTPRLKNSRRAHSILEVSLGKYMEQSELVGLTDIVLRIIPALLCISFHEVSHGFIANLLGDRTAKEQGRLTLNPINHIDPIWLLIIIFFGFGWAKPVPVNMMNFKNPKQGMAISALAGPISNIVLAIFVLFVYGALYPFLSSSDTGNAVLTLISTTAYLSIALGIFNLIPIPPLDGSKVLFSIVSDETYYKLMRYERYGMILLLIVVASGLLGSPLTTAVTYVYDKLFVVATAAYNLFQNFV